MRRKYSKLTIYLVTLVMGAGMITFPADDFFKPLLASSTRSSDTSLQDSPSVDADSNSIGITPTAAPTITPMPLPSPSPTPVPSLAPEDNLISDQIPADIAELVQAYFNSRLTSIDDYRKLIYNDEYVDENLTYRRVEYVVAYHDLKCYLKQGTGIIDYVVYVVNDVEIATIDTFAPSIDVLYVIYEKDGSAKIYLPGDELTEAELRYYQELNSSPDVAALVADVETRLTEAMEADSELRDFLLKISEPTPVPTE